MDNPPGGAPLQGPTGGLPEQPGPSWASPVNPTLLPRIGRGRSTPWSGIPSVPPLWEWPFGTSLLDHLHQLTTTLAKTHGRIVVEAVTVKGTLGKNKLARALFDSGFPEFRRQLTSKCPWYGSELVVANRWFPSSKTCSRCGTVKQELSLSERSYRHQSCGLVLDRDQVSGRGELHPPATHLETSTPRSTSPGGPTRPSPPVRRRR